MSQEENKDTKPEEKKEKPDKKLEEAKKAVRPRGKYPFLPPRPPFGM